VISFPRRFPSIPARSIPLLAAALALGALPLSVHGQVLFVTNYTSGMLGKYDATTGATINATFISGLSNPTDVKVSGSTLFTTRSGVGRVTTYDANTGALLNFALTDTSYSPIGLALSGNDLFVSFTSTGAAINEYNAATGAVIDNNLVIPILGMGDYPEFIAVMGSSIYAVSFDLDAVGVFSTVPDQPAINPAFITGLNGPNGIAFSGSNLFVVNSRGGTVSQYDAATGALINASFVSGLNWPTGVAVSGSRLYVSIYGTGAIGTGSVGEYDSTTGAVINASLVTGLSGPDGLASRPRRPRSPSDFGFRSTGGG